MDYTEFEDFIEQSTTYLRARNEEASRFFGIGDYARYEYDLRRGEIWWSDQSGPRVRGRVTIVGSYSTKSETWLWSWGNPHFNDIPKGAVDEVRAFGEREAIGKLTEAKWPAEEIDGWEMTAVSSRLLEAQGAYRSPDSSGALFLLFDHLEFIPDSELDPYMPLDRPDPDRSDDAPNSAAPP